MALNIRLRENPTCDQGYSFGNEPTPKPQPAHCAPLLKIEPNPRLRQSIGEVIDQESGLRDRLELLENILSQAGDLIESRRPELVAYARTAIRHY
jgi:hypothetical protein